METAESPETSTPIYQISCHHIPEESNIYKSQARRKKTFLPRHLTMPVRQTRHSGGSQMFSTLTQLS